MVERIWLTSLQPVCPTALISDIWLVVAMLLCYQISAFGEYTDIITNRNNVQSYNNKTKVSINLKISDNLLSLMKFKDEMSSFFSLLTLLLCCHAAALTLLLQLSAIPLLTLSASTPAVMLTHVACPLLFMAAYWQSCDVVWLTTLRFNTRTYASTHIVIDKDTHIQFIQLNR